MNTLRRFFTDKKRTEEDLNIKRNVLFYPQYLSLMIELMHWPSGIFGIYFSLIVLGEIKMTKNVRKKATDENLLLYLLSYFLST